MTVRARPFCADSVRTVCSPASSPASRGPQGPSSGPVTTLAVVAAPDGRVVATTDILVDGREEGVEVDMEVVRGVTSGMVAPVSSGRPRAWRESSRGAPGVFDRRLDPADSRLGSAPDRGFRLGPHSLWHEPSRPSHRTTQLRLTGPASTPPAAATPWARRRSSLRASCRSRPGLRPCRCRAS